MKQIAYRVARHIIKDPLGPGYLGFATIEWETGSIQAVWPEDPALRNMLLGETIEEAEGMLSEAVIKVVTDHFGPDWE
jgi:hypothetical protein